VKGQMYKIKIVMKAHITGLMTVLTSSWNALREAVCGEIRGDIQILQSTILK
jgi:hypothetical protein